MNTPTDTQLKQALAVMLPDVIEIRLNPDYTFYQIQWKNTHNKDYVRDTELLHLCWLVEETLDTIGDLSEPPELRETEANQYVDILCFGDGNGLIWSMIHATWQQRVIALAKVKGITI